jgi:hypothetical protein
LVDFRILTKLSLFFFFTNAFLIMQRKFLLLLLATLFLSSEYAFAQRNCGAMDVLARQLMENPDLQQQMEEVERNTAEFIAAGGANDRIVVTIPVVVNVVWNTAAENISDQQIQTQIDVLNADFRKLNADANLVPAVWQSIAADVEVNFCLASQDPSGAATNGIRRRQTTVTAFSTNDAVKFNAQGGLDIWDRNKYLNLWVCDISGGILGYAQFPGGAASTDGVVIDYQYFGTINASAPFNKGRTGTHEVGHWLNLRHIWGDDGTACTGTDQVADTPNQADENYGCPAFPQVSCSNGPNGDMFMNYMDYTDDACMYMFTAGQKARAQALFGASGARVSLLSSPGCNPPSATCGTPSGLNATSIAQTTATLNWGTVSGATSYNLQWKVSTSNTWTTVSNLTSTTYNLTGLTASTTYNYQVQAVCTGGNSAYSTAASFTTLATGGGNCTDAYEANNTRNTAKVIPVNTDVKAQIATATDVDWNRFSNTNATRNIKIDLTTLPADYDLKLYRTTSLLATSELSGTSSEQIIYNTNTVSTSYYAQVYGYGGAFSNTQCYTLRVSLSATAFRTDGSTDGPVEEFEIPLQLESLGFGLYPNPATNQVIVEVPMIAEQDVMVSIIDPAGKAAITQHRTLGKGDNQITFDVQTLPSGVYFVQVRNGESVLTRKLVKN